MSEENDKKRNHDAEVVEDGKKSKLDTSSGNNENENSLSSSSSSSDASASSSSSSSSDASASSSSSSSSSDASAFSSSSSSLSSSAGSSSPASPQLGFDCMAPVQATEDAHVAEDEFTKNGLAQARVLLDSIKRGQEGSLGMYDKQFRDGMNERFLRYCRHAFEKGWVMDTRAERAKVAFAIAGAWVEAYDHMVEMTYEKEMSDN